MSDSAFLHQFRTGRARHGPAAQAHNSGLSSRALMHIACLEPWFQATTEVPRKGTEKDPKRLLWGVGSGGWGRCGGGWGGVETQTFRPTSLLFRHLLSLPCLPLSVVKPPGWEGRGQAESSIQLSCLGWGPAPSLDPRPPFPHSPYTWAPEQKEHACVFVGEGEYFCVEPTSQLNKRAPQTPGCGRGSQAGPQALTESSASQHTAWP